MLSRRELGIRLESNEEASGVLVRGDVHKLRELLGCQLTVYGKAVSYPSGRLLRIDADRIVLASDRDRFFTTIPHGIPPEGDLKRNVKEQATRPRLAAVRGKWPGDETDEQIQKALGRMSESMPTDCLLDANILVHLIRNDALAG